MTVKILALIFSTVLFLTVVELIRRRRLSFKYALGWLLIAGLTFFMALFDTILFRLAYGLGFELPSNFIFFAALIFTAFLSLLLTIFVCQQNSRNEKIAQKLGLIENKLEALSRK